MKIAIIGSHGYPIVYGGYETFVKELAERLTIKNIEVSVYCIKNDFLSYPRIINGINLVYIKTSRKKNFTQLIYSFQAVIHAIFSKYDLIILLNSANGIWGLLLRLFNKKAVINVDGVEWERPKWKGVGSIYYIFSSWMATKFFKYIITDSKEMRKVYLQKWKKDSEVIAYGANLNYKSNTDIISRLNITKGSYYLVVGRLIPDNNADFIIKEFISSSSAKYLVVVGDDKFNGEFSKRIKMIKHRKLIFTGYITNRDELNDLYLNSYVYIHGHEYGGTNPTLLEALASGSAVLALNTCFNKEVLSNANYGVYFNKEKNALSKQIQLLDSDQTLIDNMRNIARDRIKENYSWEKITDEYMQLFKRLQLIKEI